MDKPWQVTEKNWISIVTKKIIEHFKTDSYILADYCNAVGYSCVYPQCCPVPCSSGIDAAAVVLTVQAILAGKFYGTLVSAAFFEVRIQPGYSVV